ncbi:MAG: class E sortase [Aquihabitans sp.]
MVAKVLGGVGRSLMTAGTLILLFVAYQLWGTGLQEARSQEKLRDEFSQTLQEVQIASSTTSPTTTTTVDPGDGKVPVESTPPVEALADLPLPEPGDAVAEISIPDIGITRIVVEGVTVDQLKRGTGHYPTSPLPGQKGNVSIAGHRTTYGQPFHNVDKLDPGDQIFLTTIQGDFVYSVESLEIVKPDQVEILEDKGDNRLTLIACHPKYSLAERLIVHAVLEGTPAPELVGQAEARAEAGTGSPDDPFAEASIDGGLSGETQARTPAVLWGLACAAVWLLTWLAQTAIRRRTANRVEGRPTRQQRLLAWSPYLVGVPVFMVTLYVFFENFSLLLPGNY